VTRFGWIFGALLLTVAFAASAKALGTKEALKERVLGDPKAPITMIEYSSLGCPHCARFHKETLPDIKKNYIDTGKAKLIYRDYPLGGAAYAASMMARCAPPSRYFQFIEVLFKNQESWANSKDPRAALARIGKLGGMSQADFDACLKNEALFQGLRNVQLEAKQTFEVNATPTFIINGEKVSGARPYEDFRKVLDNAK
jgi:protein-disulfide isomerase